MNILISACLLGVKCRYDGNGKKYEAFKSLPEKIHLIPVCPEQLGGLPTPRPKAEIKNGRVINMEGKDVTLFFERGAEEALHLAALFGCRYAILKENSPSCGKGQVYSGDFSGSLVSGDGVCARLLSQNGIKVFGESQIENLLEEIGNE